MMAGSVDEVVPCWASIDYYDAWSPRGQTGEGAGVSQVLPDPGMAHGGGPGMNHPPDMLAAVRAWREKGVAPGELIGTRTVNGKEEWKMPVYPYPKKTAWDAATSSYHAVDGPRGGVGACGGEVSPGGDGVTPPPSLKNSAVRGRCSAGDLKSRRSVAEAGTVFFRLLGPEAYCVAERTKIKGGEKSRRGAA